MKMSLSIVSKSSADKENMLLQDIFKCIDGNKSMIFNSGAGAGKTYALVESLKYSLDKYEKNLKRHKQKIICITYTNVAAQEIKSRLGSNNLVKVSTIHEQMWDIIKTYKKELVIIHKERLLMGIKNLNEELDGYTRYQTLNNESKEKFKKLMTENKNLFYENYNVKASVFKNIFSELLSDYTDLLRNNAEFKKIVTKLFKIDKFKQCIENINLKKKEYNTVTYNPFYNKDQLHKMRISHNTLLEYSLQLVENYDLLKQIIINRYPYIFIDEYQDTDKKVVLIMNYLQQHADKISHNVFIGYFGDTVQNIYDSGVGKDIDKLHLNLEPINKEFNRRSTKEIIDVINKIRNDDIKQVSIYDDCEGGSVKFYNGQREDLDGLLLRYKQQWDINQENQLHVLVLTNESVARYSGFENIYNLFKQTKKYKINYDQLNTELLSKDISKLGEVPNLLFRIIQLRNYLTYSQTPVVDILKNTRYDDMSFIELRELIKLLKHSNSETTLNSYIKSLSSNYINDEKGSYREIINSYFDLEKFSVDFIKEHLFEKLFSDIPEEETEEANQKINKILEIELCEFDKWYNYIKSNYENNSVIYHTYHGTKGLEFDNVIIIMENSFGKSQNYFNYFFENYRNESMGEESQNSFEKIRNLLYVSCSRAVKNLRVIYIDDITDFQSDIELIFGEITHLSEEMVHL